jgi:unsaturated rhamnogalacturonyl hydrolase
MKHLVRIFFLLQAIVWGSTPILWAKELAAYPISLQPANVAPAGLYRDNTWGDQLMAYAEKEFPADQYYWDWAQAPLLRSIADRWENGMNQESTLSYIRKAMDVNMDKAGGIHPNVLASGFGMAFLARITGEQRYREKAFELYRQYLQIPRSSNGGVSHRDHVIELWDDTVYMISLFLTEMYRLTGDEQFLKELAFQLTAHAEKLEDSKTGLWYHGWDNDLSAFDDKCCMPGWADNPNRRNSEFWGRGNGWVAMTFANTLRVMPDNMEEKKALKQKFVRMMQTLSGLQEKKTGHWYQLPFRPGERGNFIESSGTAMFAYAMSVGVAEKLLEKRRYMPIIKNAFRGIGKYSLKPVDGLLTVVNVCYGTCIGNKTYYYARKVVEGTPFTLGAAIMFYDQYNILINKKKNANDK